MDFRQYHLRSVTITNVNSEADSAMTLRSGRTVYRRPAGTGTTPQTRAFAQRPRNIPARVQYSVSTSSGYQNTWRFNNPQTPGQPMDAGHIFPNSGGGPGHRRENIYGQDRNINRGWGGTFNQHRRHERDFVRETRVSQSAFMQHRGYRQ